MADTFRIIPYVVRSAGTDVPPEEVQAAVNSLAQQTTIALNSVASDPTGPAGGDLGGTYPNPTVVGAHITTGTINGTVVGGTTPAAGHFTTLDATTPVAVTSGGTGRNALTANAVVIGEGSSQVNFAAPGTAGGMLISQGAAADPAFANNPTITGGTINSAVIGGTTPAAGTFTALSSTSGALNGSIGATTPNTGSFTTLAASGTVSGAGFTARFASPGPIGNTAASTGAFTTLSSTGAFTPSSTNGIVGTTTNDSANAGSIGEYQEATSGSTSITSNTSTNIVSLSLTAGDWDVTGAVQYIANAGTTISTGAAGVSTTSATLPAIPRYTFLAGVAVTNAIGSTTVPAIPTRISLSTTTTVFLVGFTSFAGGTANTTGFISARRRR
jgi:hypothetical protein